MRWIATITIIVIGAVAKNCNWSKILSKTTPRRNHGEMYGFDYEHGRFDWSGWRWFDAYDLQE